MEDPHAGIPTARGNNITFIRSREHMWVPNIRFPGDGHEKQVPSPNKEATDRQTGTGDKQRHTYIPKSNDDAWVRQRDAVESGRREVPLGPSHRSHLRRVGVNTAVRGRHRVSLLWRAVAGFAASILVHATPYTAALVEADVSHYRSRA